MRAPRVLLMLLLPASALAQGAPELVGTTEGASEDTTEGATEGAEEPAEDAGPPLVELDEGLVAWLLPGSWVYTGPDLEAARARWKAPVADPVAALDEVRSVALTAEQGDFLRISAGGATGSHPCGEGLATFPLAVDLWVKPDSLATVVTAPVDLAGGGASTLHLEPGLPAVETAEGRHTLVSWGARIEAPVPAEALGQRFRHGSRPEALEPNAGLPGATNVRAEDESFAVSVPKREGYNQPVHKHAASAAGFEISVTSNCYAVRGLTQDAVGMHQPSGGLVGGILGSLAGPEDVRIPEGTPLTWSDGSVAGRTSFEWGVPEAKVRPGEDGRSCTSWSPSGADLGPEGLLTVCWPSEADLTPAERLALEGPPREPVVLPERKPPKKAKLKGIDVPMDVAAHLAVDMEPLDPDSEEAMKSLSEVTVGKVKGLQQLEQSFAQQMIENPGDTDLVVMFAVLYEDMAASLLDAWVPPSLTGEQVEIYREQLALKALPQCDKAFELYTLAGERARSASVPPRSLKTISKALDRLKPDDRESEAERLEACFQAYNW